MKKGIILISKIIRGNITKIIIMFVILSLAGIYISTVLADYNYKMDYYEKFNCEELDNADFINVDVYLHSSYKSIEEVLKTTEDYNFNKSFRNYLKDIDINNNLKNFSAVDKVYYLYTPPIIYHNNDDISAQLFFMNNDTYKLLYNYALEKGSSNFESTTQTSEYPNAIVNGSLFKDVEIGEDITVYANYTPSSELNNGVYDELASSQNIYKNFKVHVIGKVASPYKTLVQMPSVHNQLSLIHEHYDFGGVYLLDNDFTLNYFSDVPITAYPNGSIVQYKDDMSTGEFDELKAYCDKVTFEHIAKLNEKFGIKNVPTNMIISNGKAERFKAYGHPVQKAYKYETDTLNNRITYFTLPIMAVIMMIGIIASVFIFSLIIRKKHRELEIYYICGCSRQKCYCIFTTLCFLISFLAGAFITTLMLIYTAKRSYHMPLSNVINNIINLNSEQLDYQSNCFYFVWGYLLTVFLITAVFMYFELIRSSSLFSKMINKAVYRQKRRELEKKLEQQKKESAEEYYAMLDSQNEKTKILIHDINKHLGVIKNMSGSENGDIANYIETITNDFDIANPIDYSNNAQLNLIVNRYKELCDRNDIKLNIDVCNAKLDFMDNPDITALFDNLLENAYEAAQKCSSAFIDLIIRTRKSRYLTINITNSVNKIQPIENNKIKSEKSDSTHGFGLKSINNVVLKYIGEIFMEYDQENMTFNTRIVFEFIS